MKLKENFVTHADGGQQMMVDVSAKFSGLIRSNQTAAEIVELLKSETTEQAIVLKLLEKYEVSEEVLQKDVHQVLLKLQEIGAIEI